MAIFLGAKSGDILGWRSVTELVNNLQGTIGERMSHILSAEGVELLRKVRGKFDEELAKEERLAAEFAGLFRELELAGYEDELPRLHKQFIDMAAGYFRERESVLALHSLCTAFCDELVRKALRFAERFTEQDRHDLAPDDYCWVVGGGCGRGEQTLRDEPDFFLIYRGTDGETATYFEKFSYRVMAVLEGCGLMKSPPNTVPAKKLWRGSFEEWRAWLEEGVHGEMEARLSTLSLLADLRSLQFEGVVTDVVTLAAEKLKIDPATDVLRQLAKKAVGMPVALGVFGGFRVERTGPHRGSFNLERYALAPLIMNVRVLAIGFGVETTGTVGRIKGLQNDGRISVELAERLLMAFHQLFRHKILLEITDGGENGGVFLNPDELTDEEREQMKESLDLVASLQKIVFQTFLEYV